MIQILARMFRAKSPVPTEKLPEPDPNPMESLLAYWDRLVECEECAESYEPDENSGKCPYERESPESQKFRVGDVVIVDHGYYTLETTVLSCRRDAHGNWVYRVSGLEFGLNADEMRKEEPK